MWKGWPVSWLPREFFVLVVYAGYFQGIQRCRADSTDYIAYVVTLT